MIVLCVTSLSHHPSDPVLMRLKGPVSWSSVTLDPRSPLVMIYHGEGVIHRIGE